MRKQDGLSMSVFLIWAVILIVVALVGFKVGPPYVEYYAIQKQLKIIADEADAAGTVQRKAIQGAFVRRASVEDIRSIGPDDLQISKEGDQIVISADYSVRVPLVGNISACMDFSARSNK